MSLAILTMPSTIDLAAAASQDGRQTRLDKAMRHCKAEWKRAYELAQKKGQPAIKAQRMAAVAYKLAMPPMDSLPGIRAAVACVAQGIQLEVFDGRDGSQLLYAAQVALSLQREKGTKTK